jgi:hypothetical protein
MSRWIQQDRPNRSSNNSNTYIPGVGLLPIGDISQLVREVTSAMNSVPESSDYDPMVARRLYYYVRCLRVYFPHWRVALTPHRIAPQGTISDGESSEDPESGDSETELIPR